jgi:nucleotide-binding universal stress UspA family protein
MFEKILVPLDGSPLAEVALPYARELSLKLESELVLFHACDSVDKANAHVYELYLDAKKKEAQGGRTKKAGPRTFTTIVTGNPAEEIVRYAEGENVSLILMATHGRSGIGRWTLGSVADKVVRASDKPVALIRARGDRPAVREKAAISRILVTLDGSPEGETVLPYVSELALRLNSEVILVQFLATGFQAITPEGYGFVLYLDQQVKTDENLARAYLDRITKSLTGITVRTEVKFGSPALGIIKMADSIPVDLVAMTTHGRSGVERFVLGSVADRVLHDGTTPLLLVRAKAQKEKSPE